MADFSIIVPHKGKDNYPGLDREGCRVLFTTEAGGAGYAREMIIFVSDNP